MAWAVTAIAAVFTAEAVTAVVVFEAIAAVGLVSSVAGMITGNKDLIKFGSICGIVGGIGMAAGAAGLLGETAATTGVGVGAGTDAAAASLADAGASAAPAAADLATGAVATPLATTAPVVGTALPAVGTDAAAIAAGEVGTIPQAATGLVPQAAAQPVASASTDIAAVAKPAAISNEVISSTAKPDFVQKLMDSWTKLKPETQASLVKVGGEALSGLSSGANKTKELDMQQNQQTFNQQLATTAQSNANAQPTNITGMTYNPSAMPFAQTPVDPRMFVTQPTGMIAPQPATPAGR